MGTVKPQVIYTLTWTGSGESGPYRRMGRWLLSEPYKMTVTSSNASMNHAVGRLTASD